MSLSRDNKLLALLLVLFVAVGMWFVYDYTSQVSPSPQQAAVIEGVPEEEGERLVLSIHEREYFVELADTQTKRTQGLSGRDMLSPDTVMLFVFPTSTNAGIWMRNMHFPLDIAWLGEAIEQEGEWVAPVVHAEVGVSPDTYPKVFESPLPARYVIEANTGVFAEARLGVGDVVVLPHELFGK